MTFKIYMNAFLSLCTYLKEFFQLNNGRYRTGKRANVHFDLVTLVYNASKLAVDRIRKEVENAKKQLLNLKNLRFPH